MSVVFSGTFDSNITSGTKFTEVQRIAAAALVAAVGPYIRVTLKPGNAGGQADMLLDDVFVGHVAASGDAYDFDGNQVRLTFSGSNSVTLVMGAASAVSDPIPFTYDSSKALIVAFDHNGIQATLRRNTSAGANLDLYFESTLGNDAGTTNKSGYSLASGLNDLVETVEIIGAFKGASMVYCGA